MVNYEVCCDLLSSQPAGETLNIRNVEPWEEKWGCMKGFRGLPLFQSPNCHWISGEGVHRRSCARMWQSTKHYKESSFWKFNWILASERAKSLRLCPDEHELSEEVVLTLVENPVITSLRTYSTRKCQFFISKLPTSFTVYRRIIKMPACLVGGGGSNYKVK